jgi:curved DNA-binding protein CbpA
MAPVARDPYEVLGVKASASDDEVHAAYRRLVKLQHPDHNGGSPESARRFEEVQGAYARVRSMREQSAVDPDTEDRLADLERRVREAHLARERARRAAAEAAARTERRPSDEELGYVHTDDSFSKLLDDAGAKLSEWLDDARDHPAAQRVADLVDELASKVGREGRDRRGG